MSWLWLQERKEYYDIIINNMKRIHDKIEEKQYNLKEIKTHDIFDLIEEKDDIIREYSSKCYVCRVTYKKEPLQYYWSCCGSRSQNHLIKEDHWYEIDQVNSWLDSKRKQV